jgi:HEAT repeat protein
VIVALKGDDKIWERIVLKTTLEELRKLVPLVRLRVVAALGDSKSKQAVSQLVKIGSEKRIGRSLLREVVIALGKIEDPRATSFIKKVVLDDNGWLSIRKHAVAALGRIGDKRAVPVLAKIAFSSWPGGLRSVALSALCQFPDVILSPDPSVRNKLANLMASNDFELRRAATLLLAGMSDKRAVPGLLKMLSEYVMIPEKLGKLLTIDPSLLKTIPPIQQLNISPDDGSNNSFNGNKSAC